MRAEIKRRGGGRRRTPNLPAGSEGVLRRPPPRRSFAQAPTVAARLRQPQDDSVAELRASTSTPDFNANRTLGLYVHLPFCRVHCTYCPFAVSTDIRLQDRYTDALLAEVDARGDGTAVDSIFFGGGTPSRTSRENLVRIVARLRERFEIEDEAEFSLEANPEDVTEDAVAFWRSLGVNRLSIGVQSFHDEELRPLGRVHGREQALEAIRIAVTSGIRTSLDLMLGLPRQTAQHFQETLTTAIATGAGHVSLYMLDLEEGTSLARQVEGGRVSLPDDDLVADLYTAAIERFAAAGFAQYEISNFARPGEECRHNLRYWRREEYLGFGIAAHSFAGDRRFANTRDIHRYIEGQSEPEFAEVLGDGEVRRETIFLGLRQAAGINYDDVVRLCGEEGIEWMNRGLSDGWLRRVGNRVAFTPSGFLLSNDYISRLF
ncbi:MAG TPA: radical SAM family heme chaperone HemW [Thermoanaerobaculia bacterium]|nr:radical SAM family heme chaperone HemW [Thermoanaerobaculia bacterium]